MSALFMGTTSKLEELLKDVPSNNQEHRTVVLDTSHLKLFATVTSLLRYPTMESYRPLSPSFDAEPKDKAFICVRIGTASYELEVDVKITFDDECHDEDEEDFDYDTDDFDKLCSPKKKQGGISGAKTRPSHDDRELALLLDREYGRRGVKAEKTLKYFQSFDMRSNIDPDRSCTGDPAVIEDSHSGQQFYLCFAGYKALWGSKGGRTRDMQGVNLRSLRSIHKSFKGFSSAEAFRAENPDYPVLMLIKSPRPSQKVSHDKILPALAADLFTTPVLHGRRKRKGSHGPRDEGSSHDSNGGQRPSVETKSRALSMDLVVADEHKSGDMDTNDIKNINESTPRNLHRHEGAIEKLIREEIEQEVKRQVQQTVRQQLVANGLIDPEQL